MDKNLREKLKEWYCIKIESESPLKLSERVNEEGDYDENGEINSYLSGLPAELLIQELKDELEEEEEFDISKYNDDDILLITADVNYADEFDLSDFTTMDVKSYKELSVYLKNYDEGIEWYFGTNENLEFTNGSDLLSCFDVRLITHEESDTIDNLFGGGFGSAGVFDYCYELMVEDEEEEEEKNEDGSILSKSDKIKIEILEEKGWKITEDIGEYMFLYNHDEHGESYSGYSMIMELYEYYKKRSRKL